jgi:hypothetical protein
MFTIGVARCSWRMTCNTLPYSENVVPVAFGAFQPCHFDTGSHLVDQERVQGLDLAVGHGGVAGMPGLVGIRSTAHELISETGNPPGRPQHIAVNAGPGT